jgi:hypothetical protein
MLTAAMPVDAVTNTLSRVYLSRSVVTISRSRNDLPVPAEPVKNTLPPLMTWSMTA